MTLLARVRDLDARAWSSATWAAPFVTQVVLGLVIAASWLLGKTFPGAHGALLFLAGAATVLILSMVVATLLLRSSSPRARGLSVSVAGAYCIVFVGGIVYGFWILEW